MDDSVAARAANRVEQIVEAAEAAAAALTCEAQQRAERRLSEAEAEAERRLDAARRQAEALEAAQRQRTAMARSLSDSARAALAKLEEVATVRADLEQLLHALESEPPRFADEHTAGGAGDERSADGSREDWPARRFELPRDHARRGAWEEGYFSPGYPDLPPPDMGGWEAGRPPRDGDEDAAARLVAVHMAAAGSSRGEVALHLERTFHLADPGAILDGVFGATNGSIGPSERRVPG